MASRNYSMSSPIQVIANPPYGLVTARNFLRRLRYSK
jgi:hypothetical protein